MYGVAGAATASLRQVRLHSGRALFGWKYALIDGASLSNESGLIALRIGLQELYDLSH
jgi:hypothetical protein